MTPVAPFWYRSRRRDHVFRFDLVQRGELPVGEQLLHRPDQPQQNIYLMDGLIDERAAAFRAQLPLMGRL